MDVEDRAPVRLALIGLGSIGGAIADAAASTPAEVKILAAMVADGSRTRALAAPPCVTSLEALLATRPDVIIECAGQAALRAFGPAVLRAGCDLVAASVGLFAEDAALDAFHEAARLGRSRIRLSGGAVIGIDGLLGARRLGLDAVRYRFVMSPATWAHAGPQESEASVLTAQRTVVYRGNARDAARTFPRHANVTATIALAGVGFERTEVELVVDPEAVDNRHEIAASGFFGTFAVTVQGRRISPSSPSSRLVAGSLLSAAVSGAPALI